MKRRVGFVRRAALFLVLCIIFPGMGRMGAGKAQAASSNVGAVIEELELMNTDTPVAAQEIARVTRAQFAQILMNLSGTDEAAGAAVSIYQDVTKKHWAATYIRYAVENGWMSAYLDGTFRPDEPVTLREAVYGILRVMGYELSDFTGGMAEGVSSLYRKKELNEGISLDMTFPLTRSACERLLYNTLKASDKSGNLFGSKFNVTLTNSGDINYSKLVSERLTGPEIVTLSVESLLPFSASGASYYRDGISVRQSDIQRNDVIYYSTSRKTVWAYSTKATGTVESVSPSDLTPTSVTIAGKEYALGTEDMQEEFSVFGSVKTGDVVTALLGSDGSIVGVADTGELLTGKAVILLGISEKAGTGGVGMKTYINFADASAAEYEMPYDGKTTDYKEGTLLYITVKNGTVSAAGSGYPGVSINGKVSGDGSRIGDYTFAANVQILDTKGASYQKLYPSRLAGAQISEGYVRYCKLNENGEITELILDNYTGDLYQYGMLLDLTSSGQSYTVEYDMAGVQGKLSSDSVSGSIGSNEAAGLYFGEDKTEILSLTGVQVMALQGQTVSYGSSSSILLSEKCAVYYKEETTDGTKYTLTSLDKVGALDQYWLMAYYDKTQDVGGRVRVIVASAR